MTSSIHCLKIIFLKRCVVHEVRVHCQLQLQLSINLSKSLVLTIKHRVKLLFVSNEGVDNLIMHIVQQTLIL